MRRSVTMEARVKIVERFVEFNDAVSFVNKLKDIDQFDFQGIEKNSSDGYEVSFFATGIVYDEWEKEW